MKPNKIKTPKINDTELPNYDIINDVIGSFSNHLTSKMDNLIIEGLKIKGFEFNNKIELESFIKERCRCEDNIASKERIYYVDDIPFFLHNYKSEIITTSEITSPTYKLTGDLGYYAYL